MFLKTVFLIQSIAAGVVAGQCEQTETTGCLNGESYQYSTQFPCGSTMYDGSVPIYDFSSTGCCAQGLPFSVTDNYCCYDGIHDWSSGYCGTWSSTAKNPGCYDCTTNVEGFADLLRSLVEEQNSTSVGATYSPVDTSKPNTGATCDSATSSYGCLNTYKYDWANQYPCHSWLLGYSSHGCCDGAPYSLTKDSCCMVQDSSTKKWSYKVVTGNAHACSCTQYGCDPKGR